jgi:sporulation protein YlmC with PRC-barrel domain
MDKEVAKSLGKKTPLVGPPRLEIAVDQIKSMSEKMVLAKPVNELGEFLKKHEGVHHISSFLKMQVVGTGGKVLGQVQDIQLEPSTWKMPSLAISIEREVMDRMKMKKPFMGRGQLTLSTVHVNSIKDYIMLNTDQEGLARLLESSPVKKN